MDKQTKLLKIILVIVIILGFILALKVTEDIGKIFICCVIVEIILIGFYKAFVKLGISKKLLKIGFIILPILCAMPLILLFLGSLIPHIGVFVLLIQLLIEQNGDLVVTTVMMIIAIIELLVLIYIHYSYFKRLDMNGLISFLLLIPLGAIFIRNLFVNVIALFIVMIMLVYGAISIKKLAEYFNKSKLYAFGIFFLPFIFIPILGYSKDKVKIEKQ